MNAFIHYTPMTDTTELSSAHRGAPVTDLPTAELHVLDFLPSVPTRHAVPRVRVRNWFRRQFPAAGRPSLVELAVLGTGGAGLFFMLHAPIVMAGMLR